MSSSSKKGVTNLLKKIRDMEKEIRATVQESARKVSQVETLTTIASSLHDSLDFHEIIRRAQSLARSLMHAEAALVYWQDGSRLWYQPSDSNELYHISHLKSCAENRVFKKGITEYGTESSGRAATAAFSSGVRNWMVSPLIVRGKTLGVLEVVNRLDEDFSETDIPTMEAMSCQVAIALENARVVERTKRQFLQTAEALATAVDMKDPYTGGHTRRVTYFCTCIAECFGLAPDELEDLKLSAILHDIGKIGIQDSILGKKAPLTVEEFEIMKRHPEVGYEIMGHIEGMERVVWGLRYHHERYDGKGYPLGLSGEQIPLIARIVAVADAFDAMVSNRPYREGLTSAEALQEILDQSGKQFDPKIVAAFVQAFEHFDLPSYVRVVIQRRIA